MDEAWKQLPRAAVIVCASVLGAGAERSAQAQSPADAGPAAQPYVEQEIQTAPTCGAACHGGDQPPDQTQVAPPPIEPAKKGCAVEDADEHSPLGLALLGVGLLAGVAGRRRREDDSNS